MYNLFSLITEYTAKILHSPILQSNLFNFLVMIFLLYKFAGPFIKKSIENTANKTKETIEASDSKRKEAEDINRVAKEKYSETPKEIDSIIRTANSTLSSLERKASEDTEKIKTNLEANADRAVESETARVSAQLTINTAQKSLSSAKDNILKMLSEDENLHDRLIEQAIDELEFIK